MAKKKAWQKITLGGKNPNPGSSLSYKTGNWKAAIPVIDKKTCINCLKCANFCPENCIKVKQEKIDYIDLNYCKGCGLCDYECPTNSIKMVPIK